MKDELFGCFKYIGIPLDVLDRMPVRDRKFYILKHNEYTERENAKYERRSNTINGEALNSYTDMEQLKIQNAQNR